MFRVSIRIAHGGQEQRIVGLFPGAGPLNNSDRDYPGSAVSGNLQNVEADAPLETVEVAGRIKWFDVSKGYGFIVPDGGGADVLLHVTVLKRDGFQTAPEGARVVCEAHRRTKGLQVFRVISMDESTAVHPAQLPAARTHVSVTPTSELVRVKVKWFNRLRGFGFANEGEGKPDIFLHMEILRRYGLTEVRPEQELLVRFGPGPKGLMAAEIRPVEGGGVPVSH